MQMRIYIDVCMCIYIHIFTPPCHTRPLAETHSMDMFMRATPLYPLPPLLHAASAAPLVQWVVYSCASNIACNADPSQTPLRAGGPPVSAVRWLYCSFWCKEERSVWLPSFASASAMKHPQITFKTWSTVGGLLRPLARTYMCVHVPVCACVCACVCICNACIFIENLYLNWNEFQIYNAVIVACFKVDAIPRNQKNTKPTTTTSRWTLKSGSPTARYPSFSFEKLFERTDSRTDSQTDGQADTYMAKLTDR